MSGLVVFEQATSVACQLPEIVASIMSQLEASPSSLFASAQVSRLWSQEAISVLWCNPPVSALKALLVLGDRNRLKIYTAKIRYLDFRFSSQSASDVHTQLVDLPFPKIIGVDLGRSRAWNKDEFLWQYLQPSLRKFKLAVGDVSFAFLRHMQEKCPLLNTIVLGNFCNAIDISKELFEVLESMQRLKSIAIWKSAPVDISAAAIAHFATRPELEYLELGKHISESLLFELPISGPIFTSLTALNCSAYLPAWNLLCSHLTGLTKLKLKYIVNNYDIADPYFSRPFSGISKHCTRLTRLMLCALHPAYIDDADILSLTSLSHLERLDLEAAGWDGIDVQDSTIAKLAKSIPQIRHLNIEFLNNFTTHAFLALGRHCKHLQFVSTPGWAVGINLFDLELEMGEPICFPELTYVQVAEVRTDGMGIAKTVEVLRRHAPMLNKWYVTNGHDEQHGEAWLRRNSFGDGVYYWNGRGCTCCSND